MNIAVWIAFTDYPPAIPVTPPVRDDDEEEE